MKFLHIQEFSSYCDLVHFVVVITRVLWMPNFTKNHHFFWDIKNKTNTENKHVKFLTHIKSPPSLPTQHTDFNAQRVRKNPFREKPLLLFKLDKQFVHFFLYTCSVFVHFFLYTCSISWKTFIIILCLKAAIKRDLN